MEIYLVVKPFTFLRDGEAHVHMNKGTEVALSDAEAAEAGGAVKLLGEEPKAKRRPPEKHVEKKDSGSSFAATS